MFQGGCLIITDFEPKSGGGSLEWYKSCFVIISEDNFLTCSRYSSYMLLERSLRNRYPGCS
jgi:hypothetical protein